jgi:hypothetical protein
LKEIPLQHPKIQLLFTFPISHWFLKKNKKKITKRGKINPNRVRWSQLWQKGWHNKILSWSIWGWKICKFCKNIPSLVSCSFLLQQVGSSSCCFLQCFRFSDISLFRCFSIIRTFLYFVAVMQSWIKLGSWLLPSVD